MDPAKWSALENDAQGISDEPKRRRNYRCACMHRGPEDAVRLIGRSSCRGGSLRWRITRCASRGVRRLATGIRA